MKDSIIQRAHELGFDDCRVTSAARPDSADAFSRWLEKSHHGEMAYLARNAGKRTHPDLVLPGAQSIITVAASYLPENTSPSAKGRGIVARYAQYADYHEVLGSALEKLTQFLDERGNPSHRSLWYIDTGPILERDLAQRSGLGFIGKHTNLISRHLGNWIFLGEILTQLPLEPDAPEKNRCGTCSRCLSACPTGALTGPFQLDARLCISYLTIELKGSIPLELRPAIGQRIYGCDDCLAACPWNRFAQEARLMKDHEREDLQSPDLLDLLALDAEGFKKRFAGTPILRTKRRGLLRNVCVALGNLGDPLSLPALAKARNDPEPLIAEHAAWAEDQILRKSGFNQQKVDEPTGEK